MSKLKIIFKIYHKILKIYWSVFVPIYLKIFGVKLGKGITFYGFPIVSLAKGSSITINDRVVLCSDSRFTQLGVNHPVILRTNDNAEIIIDDDTGISGGSIVAAEKIQIGKMCLIGANVLIFDTNFHSLKKHDRRYNINPKDILTKPIIIGDNCFIGTNAIILKGTILKENTIIPANSVIKNEP